MIEFARVTVNAERRLISVVNAGLRALCVQLGMKEEDILRLQLGAEEVFLYCVDTLNRAKIAGKITTRFAHDGEGYRITIEYRGPRGPLDKYLRPGRLGAMQVKSFEALGLCLAANLLDDLSCDRWAAEGVNRYLMTYNCPACETGERDD